MNPIISIIIPVYNRAALVVETLRSIQAQTRSDWECILIDDRSTDETPSVLRRFCEEDPRFRFFSRPTERPKGPSACRNFGFSQSQGRFIFFFDSDDLLAPDFIEAHLPKLENDDRLDFLLLRIAQFQTDPKRAVASKRKPAGMTIPEAIASFSVEHGTECFLWRRSLLARQETLWREEMNFGEDREIGFRLAAASREGRMSEDPVSVFYRYHRRGLRSLKHSPNEKLTSMLTLYQSMKESAVRTGQSAETERFVAKYLWKGMRQSCRFNNRGFFRRFNALAEELEEFPRYRQKRIWMVRHPRLAVLLYRPLFLLGQFFRGTLRLFQR